MTNDGFPLYRWQNFHPSSILYRKCRFIGGCGVTLDESAVMAEFINLESDLKQNLYQCKSHNKKKILVIVIFTKHALIHTVYQICVNFENTGNSYRHSFPDPLLRLLYYITFIIKHSKLVAFKLKIFKAKTANSIILIAEGQEYHKK